jgi:Ca-activated chloride channel family protein
MFYEWLKNIDFAYPWVLWGLAVLPVIAFVYIKWFRRKQPSMMVTTTRSFSVHTAKEALMNAPFWLRLLALACIITALARPQTRSDITRTRGEGIDIVLCMDVSGSMLSNDFSPNRLEVAKQMAAEFVKNRPGDQIGLVIFSGESFSQYPLSTDHSTLLQHIQSLKEGLLIDGTLIGEGLATSVDRLSASKNKSRIIILLTDGKEEAPETRIIDPYKALEIAKAKGVKVYTIGMGGSSAAAYSETGRIVRQTDAFLDEPLLQRIAVQTGGAYFRARDKESLQNIYRDINRLEKSDVEIITRTRFEEHFIYLILGALFFLALEIILRYTLLRTFP